MRESTCRKAYPSDVSDEEWAFVAPYLTLMREDAPQREHPLREVFNGLRWMVRTGAPWRMTPNDLPPWHTIYQQSVRWIEAECFIAMVHDLREMLRVAAGKNPQPTAAIFDGRTMQSTPESGDRAGYSGDRAGYDGAKRRKGSKVHIAVDTLGNLLALHVTPANEQERAQVAELAVQVQEATGQEATGQEATGQEATGQEATGQEATGQEATGQEATGQEATGQEATGQEATGQEATGQEATGQEATGQEATGQEATGRSVTLAYVDQGYTGDAPAEAAKAPGIEISVIKLPEAKRGFVLLPRRWVAERSFAWAARFRRLARDYERLPETLAGLHYVVFALLMLGKAVKLWQNL